MSFLAAAASDEGGITGFLLDLVEKLGPVGRGPEHPGRDRHPADPQRGGARAGRRAHQRGPDERSSRWSSSPPWARSSARSSSTTSAGRSGPRRSHAFLDRLPLVETEDVDKTFEWFERHGRSAVFFGRMVPIVRSFISVPAGVVRMPFGQFLLFTTAGSLIWNSVLIGLGVAAGDFIAGQPEVPGLRRGRGRRRSPSAGWSTSGRQDVRRHRRARAAGQEPMPTAPTLTGRR